MNDNNPAPKGLRRLTTIEHEELRQKNLELEKEYEEFKKTLHPEEAEELDWIIKNLPFIKNRRKP